MNCPVYYRFKFVKNKPMELISYEETHSNHALKIKKDNLTDDMIKVFHFSTKTQVYLKFKNF